MKYVCENSECKSFGVEDEYVSERYFYRNGVMVGENCACPHCGQMRREINPNEEVPLSEKNISIAKYTMASPEQRREILKKRSHEHYEKEIRPEKEYKLNQAVEAFKEASKK